MALVYEWGFFVKPHREEEFRAWLLANEGRLAKTAPPHYEYLGTFVPLWADEATRRDVHQVWRYATPHDFDLRHIAEASPGAFTELVSEFLSFVDETRATEETFRLYRSVTDAPIRLRHGRG